MKVFLLYRYEIWEPNMLLGIYSSLEKAEAAKTHFTIKAVQEGESDYYTFGIREEEVL